MITAAEILATTEFTKAVILPDASTTRGVFDNQHEQVFDLNATAPQIALSAADAAKVSEGNTITVDGTAYIAKDRQHNDEGIIIIHLETV